MSFSSNKISKVFILVFFILHCPKLILLFILCGIINLTSENYYLERKECMMHLRLNVHAN